MEAEKYALFGGLSENLSLGDSLSDSPERLLQRGEGRAKIYKSVCVCVRAHVCMHAHIQTSTQKIKRSLLFEENKTSQVQEFSTFLYIGRCKNFSGLIEIILQYAH